MDERLILYPGRNLRADRSARDSDVVLSSDDAPENDQLISDPARPETRSTRKVLRYEYVHDNIHDATARVHIKLMHQRRGASPASINAAWEDADHFSLAKLKSGEQVQFDLGCRATKKLFLTLAQLYAHLGTHVEILAEAGITVVGDDALVLNGREQEIIARLHAENPHFWDHIEQLDDLPQTLVLRRQHQFRLDALDQFEREMALDEWTESNWETFFCDNQWIFGFGLSYRFLSEVENQPHYGGTTVSGKGAQRGDFLLRSEAEARFTVIVDIKKPSADLLKSKPYRGDSIYQVSDEVSGGVSQIQSYCSTWEIEGAQSSANVRTLDAARTYTHGPKGILIVGHTDQLSNHAQLGSFERYRRHLYNPEILTFDELLARARFLVDPKREEGNGLEVDDYEDIPF